MTDEQKNQIVLMRSKGMSYNSIASALSLSKDTVKTYCRRNGLSGKRAGNEAVSSEFCPNCGKPITQIPGRKHLRFCCDACRVAWWNSHADRVNRKAIYRYTCACCGKPFSAYGNSHRKYCSHECYIRARFKGGDADVK